MPSPLAFIPFCDITAHPLSQYIRSCSYIRVRDVRTVTFIKRLEAMKKDPRIKSAQVVRTSCVLDVSFFTAFLLAVVGSHSLFPREFSRRLRCVQPPVAHSPCASRSSRVTCRYCSVGLHETAIEMYSELRMCGVMRWANVCQYC